MCDLPHKRKTQGFLCVLYMFRHSQKVLVCKAFTVPLVLNLPESNIRNFFKGVGGGVQLVSYPDPLSGCHFTLSGSKWQWPIVALCMGPDYKSAKRAKCPTECTPQFIPLNYCITTNLKFVLCTIYTSIYSFT